MKHLFAAAVFTTAITGAASASTVTIDFVALAAGINTAYSANDAGEYGDAEGQTFSFAGGLDVTLTSTANASTPAMTTSHWVSLLRFRLAVRRPLRPFRLFSTAFKPAQFRR